MKTLKIRNKSLSLGNKTGLMGILNVTPDSFSDGGRYFALDRAVEHGLALLAAGADILDIGGESTRPGSVPIPAEEEIARIVPVIENILRREPEALISVDTWKAEVAEAVLEAGAGIINDITGLFGSDEMAAVIAKYDAAVILMFNATMYRTQDSKSAVFPAFQEGRGLPVSLSQELNSIDLMSACHKFLLASLERALSAGISARSIMLDPGLGFGLSTEENLCLLQNLEQIVALDYPVLVAASRKRFVRRVLTDGGCTEPSEGINQDLADIGTGAVSVYAVQKGADMLRVHDVGRQRAYVAIADALKYSKS
ncbi:MAG: dihydropteroate synthase [Clostridiaceae bacterium]|jgi:dihydropteroate synthase|nr:dihydropteroate synthase [Clostridiaceae bacterium]